MRPGIALLSLLSLACSRSTGTTSDGRRDRHAASSASSAPAPGDGIDDARGPAAPPPPSDPSQDTAVFYGFGRAPQCSVAVMKRGADITVADASPYSSGAYVFRGSLAPDGSFVLATDPASGTRGTIRGQLTPERIERSLEVTSPNGGVSGVPSICERYTATSDLQLDFQGTLGAKIPVKGSIVTKGSAVSGKYRYRGSRADMSLAGSVAPDGHLAMDEKAPSGVKTGHFEGVLIDGVALGEWRSSDGARTMPFVLGKGPPFVAVEPLVGGGTLVPEDYDRSRPSCVVMGTLPVIHGPGDAARQGALNASLREFAGLEGDPCVGATAEHPIEMTADYAILARSGRFLSLEMSGSADLGGMHGITSSVCKILDPAGPLVEPSSLVIDPPRFVALVVDRIRRDARVDDLTRLGWFTNGAPANVPLPEICALGDGKVTATFPSYAVAAYMGGPQRAILSSAEIHTLMKSSEITKAFF